MRNVRSPVLLVDHAQVGSHRRFGIFRSSFSSVTFLAVLRPVQPITGWPLTTTLPPPSLPHAGILASLSGMAVGEFPVFLFLKF